MTFEEYSAAYKKSPTTEAELKVLDLNAKNGTGNADDQYLDNILNAM